MRNLARTNCLCHKRSIMNPEEERRNIRNQFNDGQWRMLLANAEFKSAWDSSIGASNVMESKQHLTRAGEIANRVVYPEAGNRQERREVRKIMKVLDEFT
jgi:hypothetical protein